VLGRHRNVSTLTSASRHRAISAVGARIVFDSEAGTIACCEMDSHADTCVAGPNFVFDEYTPGENCDVTPYSNEYQPIMGVPIVNASTAYTNPETGETVILRFNQVLWYGKKLDMSLINPNQIRYNGLVVSEDPTDRNRMFGIAGTDVAIPFEISGTTVFFISRAPSKWEIENCSVIEMTLDSPWNPAEVYIRSLGATRGTIKETTMREICTMQTQVASGKPCDCCELSNDLALYDESHMVSKVVAAVRIATASRESNLAFVGAKDCHSQVNAETGARRFRCGLETAKKTLKATTQRGVRQSMHPLTCRYRVDHLNLHRWRLNDTFYIDTLFSKVTSLAGFTCAQLITNGTLTLGYPMESKSGAEIAQALNEFINDVGIPDTLTCDLTTEQTGRHTKVVNI
jgi:hypothetical protein